MLGQSLEGRWRDVCAGGAKLNNYRGARGWIWLLPWSGCRYHETSKSDSAEERGEGKN
jgi:hypothetical protein